MADGAFAAAFGAAANGLGEGGAVGSDDEHDEADDFGAGAIAPNRLSGASVPAVGPLSVEADSDERAAR